jgi:hypothetical protein
MDRARRIRDQGVTFAEFNKPAFLHPMACRFYGRLTFRTNHETCQTLQYEGEERRKGVYGVMFRVRYRKDKGNEDASATIENN